MGVHVVKGSILDFEGDAIVNPANSFMQHGGGLAKVIAHAAKGYPNPAYPDWYMRRPPTPEEQMAYDAAWREWVKPVEAWQTEQDDHPNIPVGGSVVTSAGALPYKGIIHAVGPVWGGGFYQEETLLRSAHHTAIEEAFAHGWKRIAFPAISCGIFGYPVDLAAPVAMAAAFDKTDLARTKGMDITFCLLDDEHYEAFSAALVFEEARHDAR